MYTPQPSPRTLPQLSSGDHLAIISLSLELLVPCRRPSRRSPTIARQPPGYGWRGRPTAKSPPGTAKKRIRKGLGKIQTPRESPTRVQGEGRTGRWRDGRLRSPAHRRRTRRLPRRPSQDALRLALPAGGTTRLPGRTAPSLPVVRRTGVDRGTARCCSVPIGSVTAPTLVVVGSS